MWVLTKNLFSCFRAYNCITFRIKIILMIYFFNYLCCLLPDLWIISRTYRTWLFAILRSNFLITPRFIFWLERWSFSPSFLSLAKRVYISYTLWCLLTFTKRADKLTPNMIIPSSSLLTFLFISSCVRSFFVFLPCNNFYIHVFLSISLCNLFWRSQ